MTTQDDKNALGGTTEQITSIVAALTCAMDSIGAIRKDQFNEHGSYAFRGIDDLYGAIQPALIEHGLVIMPNALECKRGSYVTSNGKTMQLCTVKVEYRIYHLLSKHYLTVTTVGEGSDTADKAVNKAHTSSFKTAMFQLFCSPTGEKVDSEFQSPDGVAKGEASYTPQDADDEEFMI